MPIEEVVNFLLLYESINFSFWGEPKWTVQTEDGLEDGSIALLYALLKHVRKTKCFDFSNTTLEEWKEILKGNVEIPLLEERYQIITKVSKIVKDEEFLAFRKSYIER